MKDVQINDLNKQQQEAVFHVNGPAIILAGAGSGKTRVLIHKVLHLIQKHDVYPRSILMITFTNNSATMYVAVRDQQIKQILLLAFMHQIGIKMAVLRAKAFAPQQKLNRVELFVCRKTFQLNLIM